LKNKTSHHGLRDHEEHMFVVLPINNFPRIWTLSFFLLSKQILLCQCFFYSVISCNVFINLIFHSTIICHLSVLIFLLMILDLTSSLPILIVFSVALAVQLEVNRFCLATRREGSGESYHECA